MSELLGDIDALVAQVRRRTEQRALALVTQTDTHVDRIECEGRARAEAIEADLIETGRVASREAGRQRRAVADLQRRRRRLEAREARLDRVWQSAAAELERRVAGPDGLAVLAVLARDAAARLGGDEVQVRLGADQRDRIDAEVVAGWSGPAGPRLRWDPRPLERGSRGVIVSAGRVSVDATLEGRLQQARERLRDEVAALLTADDTVDRT
jgi:vacuolar-type H+-ATPase subunit E/Vma4